MLKKPTRKTTASKLPRKPYPDFPLCAHASGKWQKSIRGHVYYFGRWGHQVNGKMERLPELGWVEALELYQAQRDDLYAGRTPRSTGGMEDGRIQLRDLFSEFLEFKRNQLANRSITEKTYKEYKLTTDFLIQEFGKDRYVDDLRPEDFRALLVHMKKRWGPVRLGNVVGRVKTVFKWGCGEALFKEQVKFGSSFKKPSKLELRKHKAASGSKMLEADEIKKLLKIAPVQLKAVILLGINCGFGNNDCASLPLEMVDLKNGWVDYPRPKTGIGRKCKLWTETVKALKDAIKERPEPKTEKAESLVFITERGNGWLSCIGKRVTRLMKKAKVHREGVGQYAFRHSFQTAASGCLDQAAINLVMGHADDSMAANYRDRIDDKRLEAVANYVHVWLFGPKKKAKKGGIA